MKERKLKDISDLILRLSAMQYLDITESQYPVVTLNELSWQVLRGQKKVWQKMVIVKKAKAKGELFEALRSLRKRISNKRKITTIYDFFLMLHLHRWQQINRLI